MRPKGRLSISFTNVFVTVALFASLAGTSYAAIKVTGKNIKNNSIASADIKNYTIAKKDLGKGVLESSKATPLNSVGYQAERNTGPTDAAPGDYVTVATLNLPAGAYVLTAKANLSSSQLDAARCQLQAGPRLDTSSRGLRSNATPEALGLQLATTFPAPGSVVLSCKTTDGNWSASDSKILAVKVDAEQG
jgi:hypothetical protein